MTPLSRAIVLLATLVLVAPSVAAAEGFSATDLSFSGKAETTGDGAALFLVVSDPGGTTWSLTATHAKLERTSIECRTVYSPTGSKLSETCGDVPAGSDPVTESREFSDVTLTSGGMTKGSAFLARGDLSTASVTSKTAALRAANVKDPKFDQTARYTAGTTDTSTSMYIQESIRGDFVNLSAVGGTFDAAGDLTLLIFGMDYHLASPEGAYNARTGHIETSRTGPYAQYTVERDLLTLTNAHLELSTASDVMLASRHVAVTFDGFVTAADPKGALALPTLTPGAPGKWDGAGMLDLAPANGRLAAAPAPTTLASTSSLQVGRTPAILAWVAGVVAGIGLVALGVWAVRRRNIEPADDLDLALLAMEERRWTDALPHLDRLAAKRPDDAVLLVDRALCLEEAGRLDAARAGYERALQVAPFSAEAHYYYARTLARLRMTTGAMAHLTRALSLDARLAELARGERAFAAFADHPSFIGLVR